MDEELRLRLIRALIETARDFREIQNAKVVIALRLDLIQRVFQSTRDGGFQEDKYESLFLRLAWTQEPLAEILDRRINELIRHRYTKRAVSYNDVMPQHIDNATGIDYFMDRTLLRPRDVIMFFNRCIMVSAGKAQISPSAMKEAAGEFSRDRLTAIATEWVSDYPTIMFFVDLLKGHGPNLVVTQLVSRGLPDKCLSLATSGCAGSDELSTCAMKVATGEMDAADFAKQLAGILYRVGIVGLKVETYEEASWAFDDRRAISPAEIRSDTKLIVHAAFWRALGIRSDERRANSVDC